MTDITQILADIEQGDRQAADRLLPLVYSELRRLAAQKLAGEKPGQTLDATSLVHEAYLRLAGSANPHHWNGQRHFFLAAAEAMRRILIDRARRRSTTKHGGNQRRVELDVAASLAAYEPATDLLVLDEALTRLAAEVPAKAEVVKLRYFAGLTMDEVAQTLGISLATAERYWTFARSWLYAELAETGEPASPTQAQSEDTPRSPSMRL
jgi:RNA polymerase sigma factor (TIGR02999 family)